MPWAAAPASCPRTSAGLTARPDVVRDHVAERRDAAGLAIDRHDRERRAERERRMRLLEAARYLAERRAARPRCRHRPSRVCTARAEEHVRLRGTESAAATRLRSSRAAVATALPATTVLRLANDPKPGGDVRGVVVVDESTASAGDVELVGRDLGDHRLDALPERAHPGAHDEGAVREPGDRRLLERADAPSSTPAARPMPTARRPPRRSAGPPSAPRSRTRRAGARRTPGSRRCRRRSAATSARGRRRTASRRAVMRLRRRSSAGSIPSSAATRSSIRSRTNVASVIPGPR